MFVLRNLVLFPNTYKRKSISVRYPITASSTEIKNSRPYIYLTFDKSTGLSNFVSFLTSHVNIPDIFDILLKKKHQRAVFEQVQGGSNMTGTNCDLFTHNQYRSYLNHPVHYNFDY
jgi:hypothetical protein